MTDVETDQWDRKTWVQKKRDEEVSQKLQELHSRNPGVRVEAARRLGELKAGMAALLEALGDYNSSVRAAASHALGFSTDGALREEIVESLMAAIDDPNDFVCSAAIGSLGRLRADASREQIASCLGDPNPHVVGAAILTLGRLGPPEVADGLMPFLDNDHPVVLGAAARALAMLDYRPAGPALLGRLEKALEDAPRRGGEVLMERLIQALAALQVQAAIPVLTRIAQNEVGLRGLAVKALMELRAAQALPALVRLLEDPSAGLRKSILRMAAELNYRQAAPLLRPLLGDGSLEVRQAALWALTRLEDRGAGDPVRELCFNDPNPFIRVQAVHALVSLAGEEALPDLVALAGDVNTAVRRAAVQSLGRFGRLPGDALAVLRQAAAPDSPLEVAAAAREALTSVRWIGNASPEIVALAPAPARPLPAKVEGHRPELLELLQEWQASLPELARHQPPPSLAMIDQTDRALSYLIHLLAGRQSG